METIQDYTGEDVFYPRSPGGERRIPASARGSVCLFYPRSPGGERPAWALTERLNFANFLSTLPGRGAAHDSNIVLGSTANFLSTLPGRGAALSAPTWGARWRLFYPRSPGGERLAAARALLRDAIFLSTLPGRGAAWEVGG